MPDFKPCVSKKPVFSERVGITYFYIHNANAGCYHIYVNPNYDSWIYNLWNREDFESEFSTN